MIKRGMGKRELKNLECMMNDCVLGASCNEASKRSARGKNKVESRRSSLGI